LSVRGRIVVVDENEASRTFVCAALDAAGYEVVAVGTTLGLQHALAPERPMVVMCEVSPPLTYPQILSAVGSIRDVIAGRAPIVLCGSQAADQLEILVRACQAAGYVERRRDPAILQRGIKQLLGNARAAVPSERLAAIGSERRPLRWGVIKLLLVDDSEIALEVMQARLRASGFDVRIALSLAEVRSIIHGWSPNVIVADVNMPDMRGDDLCSRLKTAAETRDAVVMLCSSLPEDQLGRLADAAGADGFVSKSVGIERCAAHIEALCRRTTDPVVSFD
jgi:DNA-binding response OmpR family regulator